MIFIFLVAFEFSLALSIDTNYYCFSLLDEDVYTLTLENFNNFTQLHLNIKEKKLLADIYFKPRRKLILDDSLDLNRILSNDSTVYCGYSNLLISLKNIKGFDLKSNPFKNLKLINLKDNFRVLSIYSLEYSNLDFYIGNELVDDRMCSEQLLQQINENFFSKIYYLYAFSSSVSHKTSVCPFVFHKARISYLFLSSISTIVFKNQLTFNRNIQINSTSFNPLIGFLCLFLYHVDLDSRVLNKYVFKNTLLLSINGIVNQIEDELFKSFPNLRLIIFKSENIRNIFQKRNKWLKYLNIDVNKRIKHIDLNKRYSLNDVLTLAFKHSHPNFTLYDFPDADFCYFKDFPHLNLVIPVFSPPVSKLTCTFQFLAQYANKYMSDLLVSLNRLDFEQYIQLYYDKEIKSSASFDEIDENCMNFIKISLIICNTDLKKEKMKTDNLKLNSYFYIFDWAVLTKYNLIIFILFINPILNLVSLITALCTIRVLSCKEIKDTRQYSHLKVYFSFVSLYLLVTLFRVLYVCIKDKSYNDISFGIEFCLEIFRTNTSRMISILFINIAGKAFRMCSNIFYTYFTLNRFFLVTSCKSIYFEKFNKISFKSNIFIAILLSLMVNIHSFFQFSKSIDKEFYTVNGQVFNMSYLVSYYAQFEAKFNEINDYTQELDTSGLAALKILNIIKILFSDLFFVLVNVIIDVYLYKFILKKSNILSLKSFSNEQSRLREFERNKNTLRRIVSMIILNGLNFLIFRSPLIIIGFYGFVFRYDHKTGRHYPNLYSYNICRSRRFCNLLIDLAFCFEMISFFVQFWLFYLLDKNFKNAFKKNFNFSNIFKKV